MQVDEAYSIPLEEEWLDARDAGALAEALKILIAELTGWQSPVGDRSPRTPVNA